MTNYPSGAAVTPLRAALPFLATGLAGFRSARLAPEAEGSTGCYLNKSDHRNMDVRNEAAFVFAAVQFVASGTSRHFAAAQQFCCFPTWGKLTEPHLSVHDVTNLVSWLYPILTSFHTP